MSSLLSCEEKHWGHRKRRQKLTSALGPWNSTTTTLPGFLGTHLALLSEFSVDTNSPSYIRLQPGITAFASGGDFKLITFSARDISSTVRYTVSWTAFLMLVRQNFLSNFSFTPNWVVSLGGSQVFYCLVIYIAPGQTFIPSPVPAEIFSGNLLWILSMSSKQKSLLWNHLRNISGKEADILKVVTVKSTLYISSSLVWVHFPLHLSQHNYKHQQKLLLM